MQGFHDFVLFGTVALASLMSGAVYNAFGWAALNWVALPATLALRAGAVAAGADASRGQAAAGPPEASSRRPVEIRSKSQQNLDDAGFSSA